MSDKWKLGPRGMATEHFNSAPARDLAAVREVAAAEVKPKDPEAGRITQLSQSRADDTPEQVSLRQELQTIEERQRPHIVGPRPHPTGTIREEADRDARAKQEERRLEIIARLEAIEKSKGNSNDENAR